MYLFKKIPYYAAVVDALESRGSRISKSVSRACSPYMSERYGCTIMILRDNERVHWVSLITADPEIRPVVPSHQQKNPYWVLEKNLFRPSKFRTFFLDVGVKYYPIFWVLSKETNQYSRRPNSLRIIFGVSDCYFEINTVFYFYNPYSSIHKLFLWKCKVYIFFFVSFWNLALAPIPDHSIWNWLLVDECESRVHEPTRCPNFIFFFRIFAFSRYKIYKKQKKTQMKSRLQRENSMFKPE